MVEGWFSNLRKPSDKVQSLPDFFATLDKVVQTHMNQLMTSLFDKIHGIEILPVAGYGKSNLGMHIKYGPTTLQTDFEVCAMIIVTPKRVKLRVRRPIGDDWERIEENKQTLWWKSFKSEHDSKEFIRYLTTTGGY